MTCRDLGQFSVAYNTKDILNSYSSAQKAAKRRDIALAMASRDIDRSGNNQLNRLLAYRKERAIAPEFQEAQIERIAGDNYREREFQRKQQEAMDWQNNFLYNTALFAKSMLDEPSRFEREDIEDIVQRLQDEGVALGESFWNQGSRSASRAPSTREPSLAPGGGEAAEALPISVRNAFSQTDMPLASLETNLQNPTMEQSVLVPPPRLKAGKGREARRALVTPIGSLGEIDISGQLRTQLQLERRQQELLVPERVRELQGLVDTGKITEEQMEYLLREATKQQQMIEQGMIVPKRSLLKKGKGKGGRPMPGSAELLLGSEIGASGLSGLDESAIEYQLRSGGGEARDPRASIDPLEIVSLPENVMSFEEKARKMLELFEYPLEIEGQLISDELRNEFGAWLVRNPSNPRYGEKTFKKFLKSREQSAMVQASGGSVRTGAGGLRF